MRGELSIKSILKKYPQSQFAITSPSIFELYNGVYKLKYTKKTFSKQKLNAMLIGIEELIKNLNTFDLTPQSAEKASILFNQLIGKGEEINPFDCLIGAIILDNNYNKIFTLNLKHFRKIPGLELIETK